MRDILICLLSLYIAFTSCNSQALEKLAEDAQILYYGYQNSANNVVKMITEGALSLKDDIMNLRPKIENLQSNELDVKKMKAVLYDLQQFADEIDTRYEEYIKYRDNQSLYDLSTLTNFYAEVLNRRKGVSYLLHVLYNQVIGLGSSSLLNIIDRYMEKIDPYCHARKSRQRFYYDLFISITSHQNKGFLILQYAYDFKKVMENRTFTAEIQYLNELYEKRINATVTAFTDIMSRAEKIMWRCDPEKHVENVTYVELKNVFRRVLYNTRDFTKKHDSIDCSSESCPKILIDKPVAPKCLKKNCYFNQRRCSGVVKCRPLRTYETYDVCVSEKQDHGRRYDYVKKVRNGLFADHAKCSGQHRSTNRNTMSFSGIFSTSKCNMCDCICDESQDSDDSDQFISLIPVTSDTSNNYVVTGVKLEVLNHTIHIKIQQGKLMPRGFIDNSSSNWKDIVAASTDEDKPIDDYLTVIGIDGKDDAYSQPKYEIENSHLQMFEGVNKFKLDWHKGRGLYLDDLELKRDEVVTGVRFTLDETKNGDVHIMLDLQATLFDFISGKLVMKNSYWISTLANTPGRFKIKLYENDVPTLLNVSNKPDDIPHKYTEFAPSALTSNDAGQTLLPLIDIQPVTSDPPVPLMGVSLDIKRAENSGGFLILKIKTYDTLGHLNDVV